MRTTVQELRFDQIYAMQKIAKKFAKNNIFTVLALYSEGTLRQASQKYRKELARFPCRRARQHQRSLSAQCRSVRRQAKKAPGDAANFPAWFQSAVRPLFQFPFYLRRVRCFLNLDGIYNDDVRQLTHSVSTDEGQSPKRLDFILKYWHF